MSTFCDRSQGKCYKEGKIKYFVALNTRADKIGARTFQKLLIFFGDIKNVWQASYGELKKSGLTEEQIRTIINVRDNIDPDQEIRKLQKLNIKISTLEDKNYLSILKEISDPPAVLYYKGELPKEKDMLIAVVGSRACTAYGRRVAEELAYNLSKENITIVSGLALGIDSIAHRACLKAGGKTLAVLGCGLDQIYPTSHHKLAEEIIETGGAVFSEFPLGYPPFKQNFPMRNRIISGLSKATVIIEAALKSGALITAKSALEQNREVFAVPGSIYSPSSAGTNALIRMGAYPVTSYEEILLELGYQPKKAKKEKAKGDTPEENLLLKILSHEPIHIDKLRELSKLDIAALNSTLIMLEIKGLVKNIGGGQYICI